MIVNKRGYKIQQQFIANVTICELPHLVLVLLRQVAAVVRSAAPPNERRWEEEEEGVAEFSPFFGRVCLPFPPPPTRRSSPSSAATVGGFRKGDGNTLLASASTVSDPREQIASSPLDSVYSMCSVVYVPSCMQITLSHLPGCTGLN